MANAVVKLNPAPQANHVLAELVHQLLNPLNHQAPEIVELFLADKDINAYMEDVSQCLVTVVAKPIVEIMKFAYKTDAQTDAPQ